MTGEASAGSPEGDPDPAFLLALQDRGSRLAPFAWDREMRQ